MNWKKRHRSFYYKYAEDPNDIILKSDETAHLIIDVQKTYLEPKDNSEENAEWEPFFNRMSGLVIPNIKNLISFLREKKVENIFARIACHKESGIDRSLSQKKPGFNYLLLPKDTPSGQIVDESFNVVVVEDCCAAATDELHRHELEIINMIYCHVVNLNEVKTFFVN